MWVGEKSLPGFKWDEHDREREMKTGRAIDVNVIMERLLAVVEMC